MSDTLIEPLLLDPSVEAEAPVVSRRKSTAIGWIRKPGLVIPVLIVLLAIGFAVAPGFFASGDPLSGVPADKLQGPSLAHWFGTDNLGRDLYTRFVHGAALSLTATLVAVGIALVAGSIIGLLAGFVGGVVDAVLMRIVDVLLSIPALLLSLALVTALGFGTINVA
ncbi:ABC transporter permease, partial [Rhodococcus erythropolis]|nr:ABC transporter permease [Rhodococcus erythropolis]